MDNPAAISYDGKNMTLDEAPYEKGVKKERGDKMLIRQYKSSDCREIAELFYNTVHSVNAADYTEAQLNAWADGNVDLERWDQSFQEHYTVVAVKEDRIVGFGDIDETGYLDRLYVHKDFQRQGIAAAICEKLELSVWVKRLSVHASVTAMPFFKKRGYKILKEQQVKRHDVLLTNYVMEKCITNTPPLETERLLLRRFTEKDLEALYEIYSDLEVNRFLPWFPLKTMEEARAFWQERYAAAYLEKQAYRYAVCLKEENIPIGYVHAAVEEPYDLGYGLRREFWHKGIMTEAGRAVLAQVKADGIPYITATHDVRNPRSGAVMERLGMQYQYSYKEQWQPKDIPVTFRMYQLNLDGHTDRVYKKYLEDSRVQFP